MHVTALLPRGVPELPKEACLSPVVLLKENIYLLTGRCVGTQDELLPSEKKENIQKFQCLVFRSVLSFQEK